MAFGAILASLFIKDPLSPTGLILRHPPRHTSAWALGGSYDKTFQKTTQQQYYQGLLTGLLIIKIYKTCHV